MKLRFWQKTYLFTLFLFLLFFCGGIFFISFNNQKTLVEHEKYSALSEQSYLIQLIKNDMGKTKNGRLINNVDIFSSYQNYYYQQNILTEFRTLNDSGDFILSTGNLPAELSNALIDRSAIKISPLTQSGSLFVESDGWHYFCSLAPLDESNYIVVASNVNYLFNELSGQRFFYTAVCIIVSLFLGIVLFFVLKRISYPLQKLSATADEIAKGSLQVRAVVKGHDEISELAESFNNMADSVVSKMEDLEIAAEQKERIADNLSHEIRTPLTAIQGYAEYMILANLSEEEREQALAYIVEESQRLQKISDRMLKLSVMRREEVELLPLSIQPIFEHVALTISARASKQKVLFHMEKAPDFYINGDEILLESLFTNIADNAVKACNPDDTVSIFFRSTSTDLSIIIQDTGRGMTEEEVAKLGEPFYRPDKARSRNAGGAGLGITLCCQIALLHKAKLIYYSKINVGTEVHITFPLISAPPDSLRRTAHE